MKIQTKSNKKILLFAIFGIGITAQYSALCQQQDVPEPVFMNFSIQSPYIPTYHGRDPFYPLQPYSYDISKKVSIADLDYRGILSLGDKDMALFSWKHDGNYRFLLKSRKLYCSSNSTKSSNEQVVDGIVGDITGTEVVLIQGEQKIVFSRRK